jgi:predicted aspartyl protease
MRKPFSSLTTSVLLPAVVACLGIACSPQGYSPSASEPTSGDAVTSGDGESSSSANVVEPAETASSASVTSPATDPYPEAINRASSAFNLGQSAQSRDDWRLVANRWEQAIDLMASVPASSPNHATAQAKLSEYRRNLSVAQQQASRPTPSAAATPGRVVTVAPDGTTAPFLPYGQTSPNTAPSSGGDRVYQAPIVRRAGGTPVIMVTFNGNQPFEMIVDTGASGTVITQRMANALGVVPVGQTRVATASASSATFLLGRVSSVEVDGVSAQNVVVAIAGPELSTGLLGHDFFGNYDVTVRQNVVEFRER